MSLSDKIAIVTGASRGIGAGIALELAKQGAKVYISIGTKSLDLTIDTNLAGHAYLRVGQQ